MTTVDMTPANDRPTPPPAGDDGPPVAPPQDIMSTDVEAPVPDVSEPQVRGILRLIGSGTHIAFGHPAIDEHWRFTDEELDQLTPPVTAWINRNPRLRAAAQHGDAATIAVALAMYMSRNISISREVAAEEEGDESELPSDELPPDGLQPWGQVP